MKCFYAHTSSHSLTPSHMPMPSVAIVTGNTNDTHIPSLYQLTNIQCNLPMGNQSRINSDSYHSTLGLSDKHDRVFSLGNKNFGLHLGSLTPKQNFPDNTMGLLHPYRIFRTISQVSYTHTEFFSNDTAGLLHPYRFFFRMKPRVSYTQVPGFSPEGINDPLLASPNTR